MMFTFYGSISDDEEKRILNVFADSRQVVSETRCSQQIKVLKPRFEKFNLPKDVLMPRCLINFCLRPSNIGSETVMH